MAGPREVLRELRHRRAPMHLLRDVRRGLPGRGDRAYRVLRLDGAFPRTDDLRQDQAALRLRPDEGYRAVEVRYAPRQDRFPPSHAVVASDQFLTVDPER